MGMEGLYFAIPAEFVSFSTIGLGTLFALRALFIVLSDRIKGGQWRVPITLLVVAVLGFMMFAAGAGPFVLALLVVSVVGLRWWYVT